MNSKKSGIFSLLFCVLMLFGSIPSGANSAQTRWQGVTSTGTIVTEQDCPIVVEKEQLTFEINEFPQTYYSDTESFLSYSGKVTADYTFYNPSDLSVSATLVFPFGTAPDYMNIYDSENGGCIYGADTAKYRITVNEKEIQPIIRHTWTSGSFSLERDLPRILDTYADDPFFTPDLTVTKYTYKISGISNEYSAATAAFCRGKDDFKTKILLQNQSGMNASDSYIQLHLWAENEQEVNVYFFGEAPSHDIGWRIYENGACEREIGGSVSFVSSETIDFKAFALQSYNSSLGISETDWYNAMVEDLKQSEKNSYGILSCSDKNFDISSRLMRWYQYDIALEPKEKITNTVTAPIYPSINRDYDPPVYGYQYLLSPAKTWADFGELEIVINTPYFITESNTDGFAKSENGYKLTLDGLPDGELEFTLSSSENPSKPFNIYFPIEIIIVCAVFAVLLTGGIVVFVLLRKRKKKSR